MSALDPRVTAMHPDWLECYGNRRHDIRWRGATARKVIWDGRRAEEWTFVCQRCPVVRVDIRNPKNPREVWHRYYPHITGYHAEPGEGRIDPDDVARELARRARANDWETQSAAAPTVKIVQQRRKPTSTTSGRERV